MRKFETSQKDEIRAQSADSSKAYRKRRAFLCCNEMQMLTKFCRKLEPSLSFSCKNTVSVIEGTNLRPIKAMCRDERFLSIALKKHTHFA